MSHKKVLNQRTCLVSRKKYLKQELLRIVYLDNQVIVDSDYSIKTRGYYFYPSIENYNKLLNTKLLNRIFKTNIPKEVYLTLKKYFK